MKIISSSILFVLPSISAFIAPNRNNAAYHTSSALFNAAAVKASFKINPKTFLLDVREPSEWAEGHLALATPSPLSQLTSGTWMDNTTGKFSPGTFPIDRFTGVAMKPNKTVYIHCKMGGRAKQAGELLTSMGYKDVVVLTETFEELCAAGICDVITGEVLDLTD